MLTYAPYHLNEEKRQACAVLEDELLDIADTLEKVEQTALAVCGDYFLRPIECKVLPDFDPEKEAKRIQQDFAFYRAQCCILVDYLGGLQGSIRQLYNESK